MTEVLSSNEIEEELVRLGAELYRSPMYAATYVLPGSDERVCVKRRKGGKSVMKQPLVVHPRNLTLGNWPEIIELLGVPNLKYKNADLHGFPVSPTGQSKTGIAFDVPAAASLKELIGLLGGTAAGPRAEYQWQAAKLELDVDPSTAELPATVQHRLVAARIGQGKFREDLLKYWGNACALTGSEVPEVLVASHIKPWAKGTNAERLDPNNGLLLVADADRLFDRGLISFTNSGQLIAKDSLSARQLGILGLSTGMCLRKVEKQHVSYLEVHRALHGFPNV